LGYGVRTTKFHPYRHFLRRYPDAEFWLDIGVIPRAAAALCRAGVLTLEDLGKLTQEEFLAIEGAGESALAKCEEALGRPLVPMRQYWRDRGLPQLAVMLFLREGIGSVEALLRMSRAELLEIPRMTDALVGRIEQALGCTFVTPYGYWIEKGLRLRTARVLHTAGISTLGDLAAKSRDDLDRLPLNVLERRIVDVVLREARGNEEASE
jgi:hypothetical protein